LESRSASGGERREIVSLWKMALGCTIFGAICKLLRGNKLSENALEMVRFRHKDSIVFPDKSWEK
jgi:hypothetical protein